MNRKLLVLVPMLAVVGVAATGCRKKTASGDDPTKANLHIRTLNKGIGIKWLENAAEAFEKLYADSTDFQEGRTGVKITVIGDTSCDGNYLNNNVLNDDIYFTEQVEYRDLINKGKLLDITDVLNADLSNYGDPAGRTILSKLDSTMENYMNYNGKYYGVPFYDSFYGFVYDVTLWKEKGYYLSNSGDFVFYDNPDISVGSDGIAGTLDDGLPATYEEFGLLMEEINTSGVVPFVTAQNAKEYIADYLFNVVADDEGVENMVMNINLSGNAKDLVNEVSNDGTYTLKDTVVITQNNGYELTRQVGRLHALQFLKNQMLGDNSSYQMWPTHTDAQREFVKKDKSSGHDVAMIVEGSWWENEASGVLASEAKKSGAREFAIMPIPFSSAKRAEEKNHRHTYLSLSQSFGIVSASCSNQKLAKEFMKFLHSDKMLSKFTADTSITRPLNYEVSSEDQSKLSNYAKSLIYLKQHSDIVYPYSSLPIEVNNPSYFKHHKFIWKSRVGDTPYEHPWDYFTLGTGTKTVKNYFDGQYNFFSSSWATLVK
ncbi:MAG: hypothetical protein IKP50_04715 [Bacilli bacterium]|nr:hypothetical protein [Bacilli bacterium]